MREGLNVFQAFDREVNEGEYAPEGKTGRLDINWPEDEDEAPLGVFCRFLLGVAPEVEDGDDIKEDEDKGVDEDGPIVFKCGEKDKGEQGQGYFKRQSKGEVCEEFGSKRFILPPCIPIMQQGFQNTYGKDEYDKDADGDAYGPEGVSGFVHGGNFTRY